MLQYALLAIAVAAAGYQFYKMVTAPFPYSAQEWGDCPKAEEGLPIPVVFGTVMIASPNITGFSDQSDEPDTQFDPPSIHYYAAVQFSLCHGCIDKLVSVSVGGTEIWRGPHEDGASVFDPLTQFYLSAEWYSPSDGDGVQGQFVLERGYLRTTTDDGTIADLADSYLLSKIGGSKVPKSHGVATLKPWTPWYLGNAPALKPWAFRVQRIFRTDGGQAAQWYPAKAAIVLGRNLEDKWKWKVQATVDTTDYSAVAYDDSEWDEGPGGFGNEAVGAYGQGRDPSWASRVPKVGTCIADNSNAWSWNGQQSPPHVVAGTKLWLRQDLGPLPDIGLYVRCYHDDSATLWFNGTEVALAPVVSKDLQSNVFNSIGSIARNLIVPNGPNVIAYRVKDSVPTGTPKYIYAGVSVGIDPTSYAATWDMNFAHIIREILTDTIWGMGYATADINDTSFTAAADTLYNEALGGSILWDAQSTYEELLQAILRHIDGVLYVDRITGQWTLKLLRDDYDIDDLLVLDYDNVGSVQNAIRKSTAELCNVVTVKYKRAPLGDTASATFHDYGLMQEQGGWVSETVEFPFLTNAHSANLVAQRALKAKSTPVQTCTLENCSREAADLNWGDAFVLNWPVLGINMQVMRVLSIKLGNGTSSSVTIECVEDVFFTPTEPLVIPGGIAWPPQVLGPMPGTTSQTTYKTVRKYDPLDRGSVKCVFATPSEGALFDGWTETPAGSGIMVRDYTGPLTSAFFDGVDPDTSNHAGSALVGLTVLAEKATDNYDRALSGPYVVKDIGQYWTEGPPGVWVPTSTHATLTRHADYAVASAFVPSMTFYVLEGNVYAHAYATLANPCTDLGSDDLLWSYSAGETFDDGAELLTEAEIAQSSVSNEVIDITVTMASGTADFDIAFLSRVLGVASIPAGPWTFIAEAAWLTTDDLDATIALGWKVYRHNDSGSVLLFEALTAAIHNTVPEPKRVLYDAAAFSIREDEWLVLIPCLHTTSSSAVTLHLRYNSPSRGTGVTIPVEAYKKDITRRILAGSPVQPTTFVGGVIIVRDLAKPVTVTIPAGSTVVGIAAPVPADGFLMPVTIYGATNESPITLAHMSAACPNSAKPVYLSSEAGMGVTFPGETFYATRARLLLCYNATEGNWQLMPGGSLA